MRLAFSGSECMLFQHLLHLHLERGNLGSTLDEVIMMMMPFICSCRNNNQSTAIYPLGRYCLTRTPPLQYSGQLERRPPPNGQRSG